MNSTLRMVLIIASFSTTYWSLRKIKKSQIQIEDSIFWIFTAFVLMIISIFPQIPMMCAILLGIQSPSNCVFLCIIFILLVKTFMQSIRISQMDNRIRSLAQEIAIHNKNVEEALDNVSVRKQA